MNVLSLLHDEHQILLLALKLLDVFCSRMEQGEVATLTPELTKIINFLREFGENHHHKKEEEVLLPLLEKWNHKDASQLEPVIDEHLMQRAYTATLEETLVNPHNLSLVEVRKTFSTQCRNLIAFLSQHIMTEENIFLGLAEKRLSKNELQVIKEGLTRFEVEHPLSTATRKQKLEILSMAAQMNFV